MDSIAYVKLHEAYYVEPMQPCSLRLRYHSGI